MKRVKHRFELVPFVGAKPAGDYRRCVCGVASLLVQAVDPSTGDEVGARFELFRLPCEGGWHTYRSECTRTRTQPEGDPNG